MRQFLRLGTTSRDGKQPPTPAIGERVILWIFRQFFHLRSAIKGQDTARQLAFGCALGMMLGLLPKGNLLALAISLIILCSRVNLSTAALCALGFSVLGVNLDALTHFLGQAVLTYEPIVPLWRALYVLPLVPWTSFNNTVVMGSLVLGILLFYPVYRLSLVICQRWRDRAGREDEASEGGEEIDSAIPDALLDAGWMTSFPATDPTVVQAIPPVAWVELQAECRQSVPAMTVSTCGSWHRFDAASAPTSALRLNVTPPLHWESTILPSASNEAGGREAVAQ
jgi:uncharacterized protein (TIGR03546 family)